MVKHSICDICTPGPHCGMELTVEDGKIQSVRGTPAFPGSNGKLCAKGLATAQYVYREDRIKMPMRRIGPRGSGEFEPISWEKALNETAEQMLNAKAQAGAESVLFMRLILKLIAAPFGKLRLQAEGYSKGRYRVV